MKKLFLLLPALVLSLAVSATTINVSPGTNTLKTAITSAADGDVLVLESGTYKEDGNFDFTKSLTIQAKEGATPEIINKLYFRIEGGADVTFQGIKFNGSSANDHCVRSYTNSTGEEDITFINCEFINYPSVVIYTQRDTRRWNTITIRNCAFYNNKNCAVRIDDDGGDHTKQACNSLTIDNSTFANVTENYDVIYYNAPDAEHTTTLTMNHCTFYNHPKRAVYWQKSTNLSISNCIFAQPSTNSYKAVECAGGTITNCLSYKSAGYSSAATPSGNLVGNPYFVNTTPGSYDFSLSTASPAYQAGTDDENLGDLNWDTDPSAHATTMNITADAANSLKAAVEAAWPGDEIILADGTYNESEAIELDKNITIKAADGASPVIVPVKDFAISSGAAITIQGIKFDGSSQSASNFIYAADNSANSLTVEGCEFYSIGNKVIYADSEKKLVCSVDDCYFHNNTASCIHIANTVAANLTVTNSTFANNSVSDYVGLIESSTGTGTIVVDHCTFYNCQVKSTDYGCVSNRDGATTDVIVSNSIFAMPSDYSTGRAIRLCDSNTINNCLTYHYTSSTDGIRSGSTETNCLKGINPLFNDLANNRYTYSGDYVNDNVSPARNAGTDGSDLGDPRWYTPAIYPTTDFVGGYIFTAAKAKLSGNIVYETGGPDDPYIRYDHSYKTGNAEWIIKATKACYISASVNMADNTWNSDVYTYAQNHKHVFVVEVRNADNTLVGSAKEGDYAEDGSTDGWDTYPTVNLKGNIYIPEAGVYSVILKNYRNESRCGVGSVTLAYAGGDVTDIAADAITSLDVADAWFSGCTRGADRIIYPSSGTSDAWIKWNIAATETKFYDLTLNINAPNAHGFTASIYEDESAAPIASVTEGSYISTTGLLALELGRVNLVGGTNYVVIVTNAPSGSVAEVLDLTFAPVAASATGLPGTLAFSNAVLSARAHVTDGNLYFAPIGDTNPVGEWARWAVITDHDGFFLFTMGVNSSNGQSYKISIYDDSETLIDVYNFNPGSGPQTLKHYFRLAEGNYSVQVENTTNWSHGYLTSLVVTEPSMVTLDESAADNAAWADKVDDNTDYDVQIIRTLRAGMYNTFCLPFSVNSSQCKEVFGNDVEIYTLDEAIVDGFVMTVDLKSASDIYAGTPIFIKPSRDIVDPVFVDVRFARATPSATTKTHANLTGTFVRTTLLAGSDVLFLASDNLLYYPAADIECLGMRAWFALHDAPAPAPAITRARIINSQNVVTELELIGTTLPACFGTKADKRIDDGQLLIILNGKEYNALGVRIR